MNQILITTKYDNTIYKNFKIYFYTFCISISLCFFLLFYLLSSFSIRLNNIKITNLLKNKYNINSLYSSNDNLISFKIHNNLYIIGSIEIPKISISYPIIESSNDDFLKISVCRFSGPLPNRIGNLCIAGHNYKNNLMFSNLYKLELNDLIYITDLNNTRLKYVVYDKSIVIENNLDCMKESDNVEITLITCNNTNNSERIVIKAKVKG